jgi:1-acyl-sn-glycerol-3-phosphate acyltransferase
VIPTYNNGGTIADVVRKTLEACSDVIVVNDGSTDNTRQALEAIEGITLVTYDQNRGKGYALKQGFKKALELGFAYAITLDGDGQHYPENISLFLQANIDHPGALIIGSRNLDNVDRSKGSSFANKFSNFWFYIQTGKNLDDTQTGYRLYPIKKLNFLWLLTSRYEAELELLVFASWHGVELVPIPIEVYYPPREERVSHFRPALDFSRVSVLNTILCVLAVVYGLPLRIGRFLMKYLRTWYSLIFFLFFSMVIVTPACWLYVKMGKMTERKRYRLHQLIQWTARFVMIHHGIPGTRFTSKVAEGVNFDKPHIIICNHQSHLDLMCLMMLTPKIVFLTNDWVWNNPFYGMVIHKAEFYPVSNGIENHVQQLQSLYERGYSICVFPEGTRSEDCSILRFHKGAFYLAQQLGADILPIYLHAVGHVLPKRDFLLREGRIDVEVGSRIALDDERYSQDLLERTRQMRHQYQEQYRLMSERIETGDYWKSYRKYIETYTHGYGE